MTRARAAADTEVRKLPSPAAAGRRDVSGRDPVVGPESSGHLDSARSLTQVNKWWASKIGPLLAAAYLALLITPRTPLDGVVMLVVLVVSACLLATSAYVINDWFDRESDAAIGKHSTTMGLRRPVVILLIVALVASGVAPWLLLGLPAAGWMALAAIVLLPLAYSAPPLRFKERGWPGLLADAGLAHVSPTVFALAAFGAFDPPDPSPARAIVAGGSVLWAVAVGLRKIIGHELADLENDRAAGLATWVYRVGEQRARRVVRSVVLPSEVAALALVYVGLWWVAPVAASGFTILLFLMGTARVVGAWNEPLPAAPSADDERAVLYLFYRLWPAVILALALTVVDRAYAWVLAGHLLLFAPLAVDEMERFGRFFREHTWSSTVNWLRYSAFVWVGDRWRGAVNWFRFDVGPWFGQTVPNWFRHRFSPAIGRAWHGLVNWLRFGLGPWFGRTVPNWFRFKLGPWFVHSVPNWFRFKLGPWLSHTVPNWFRYRWPEYGRICSGHARSVIGWAAALPRRLKRVLARVIRPARGRR